MGQEYKTNELANFARITPYYPIYAKITGSITAGLLLSQLICWAKTMGYKEFYKTDKNFTEELGMSLYELKAAKKKLKELKLIEVERKGMPAKSCYHIIYENINKLIN